MSKYLATLAPLADSDLSPFTIHNIATCKPTRKATVAECRKFAASVTAADREFGSEFFPDYFGQFKADVARWLERYA